MNRSWSAGPATASGTWHPANNAGKGESFDDVGCRADPCSGCHIFVADKGDHYDIADGLPQNAR